MEKFDKTDKTLDMRRIINDEAEENGDMHGFPKYMDDIDDIDLEDYLEPDGNGGYEYDFVMNDESDPYPEEEEETNNTKKVKH